jgi:hypothetical protein
MRFLAIALLFISVPTLAQTTSFVSQVDKDLNIQTVAVSPLADNVSGIYSKPLTEEISENIRSDKQWELKQYPSDLKFTNEQFEDNPKNVKVALAKAKADALISGRISKGPNGLSIKLTIFSAANGLPIATDSTAEYSGFEISDLKTQVRGVFQNLKQKIPYAGVVLSRKGNLVTLNMGSSMGLKPKDEVFAIQIIKVNRHPRFKFIVGTEKVVLGKIVVSKVDDYISFGSLVSEKEANAVVPNVKFTAPKYLSYPAIPMTADGKMQPDLTNRPDSEVALGENPKEWVPERPPTFGKVGLLLGLGSYSIANNLAGVGGISESNQLTPSIHVTGEMWINPEWQFDVRLRQYVFSVGNGYPTTSTPDRLNISARETAFALGHNFLIGNDFFGSKIKVSGGWSTFEAFVDNSTPAAFNSSTYSGFYLGVLGSFPLELESKKPITLGGDFKYFLTPSLSESPTSSGNSSNSTIAAFSVFMDYRMSEKYVFKTQLMFDSFSTSFSGAGSRPQTATSASHTITTLAMGLEYMF